ncbi:MAG: helix-turn-helix domain-containing protein [Micrococcales bacterium]|nr:helix-turn-helix domain-containing protein [Micrococcales bacterium]
MSTDTEEMKSDEAVRSDTVLPPTDSDLVKDLQAFLKTHSFSAELVSGDDRIELPAEVHRILKQVALAMSQGKAVTVAPVNMRLTTSQAADQLGISRQTLVRLLEQNKLPYERPSRHRLLRLNDVLDYQQRRHVENRMVLDELTRQAAEDGLYEDSYEDYEEALRQARKGQV